MNDKLILYRTASKCQRQELFPIIFNFVSGQSKKKHLRLRFAVLSANVKGHKSVGQVYLDRACLRAVFIFLL